MEANKRGTGRTRGQDAISLLKADHERVRQLAQQYGKITGSATRDDERKSKLAERICQELEVHTQLEEELFYPAARGALGDDEHLLDEAEVEHTSARDLIRQIQGLSPDDHGYDARVTVLGEYVEHHVQEEEKQMFPRVKRAKLDLAELGERMLRRREQLESERSMQPFETLAAMLTLPIRAAAAAARAGAAAGRRAAQAGGNARPTASSGGRAAAPGRSTTAAAKPGSRSAPKRGAKPGAKAGEKAGARAGAKAGAEAGAKAGSKAATKAGAKTASRGGGTRGRAATDGGAPLAAAGEGRRAGATRARRAASAAGTRGTAAKKTATAARRSRSMR
jgi:hemerythrin-like domain-containing protein